MQLGEFVAGTAVLLLGAFAGIGELVSRYRDSPAAAIRSQPGLIYLTLNAGVSVLAFICLRSFDNPIHVDHDLSSFGTYLLQAVTAGFGAMALLRTSFFNVRIGDKDVGLGPGLVLQVVLDATDREVDRRRAQARSEFVQKAMERVSFAKARIALPAYCIALMQNLSAGDQQEVARAIDNLSKQVIDDNTMALILGLTLMTFVGGNVLDRAVVALGTSIVGLASPQIQKVDPNNAPNTGPASVTIAGRDFRTGAAVWLNNTPCSKVTIKNSTTITCDIPAAPGIAGAVALVITNPDGQSAIVADKFSYT